MAIKHDTQLMQMPEDSKMKPKRIKFSHNGANNGSVYEAISDPRGHVVYVRLRNGDKTLRSLMLPTPFLRDVYVNCVPPKVRGKLPLTLPQISRNIRTLLDELKENWDKLDSDRQGYEDVDIVIESSIKGLIRQAEALQKEIDKEKEKEQAVIKPLEDLKQRAKAKNNHSV